MDNTVESKTGHSKSLSSSGIEMIARRGSSVPSRSQQLREQQQKLRFTQAELETVQNNYSAIFNLAPVGYVTLYEDAVIKEINAAAAKMLGIGRLDLLGSPVVMYAHPTSRESVRGHIRSAFTGRDDQVEVTFFRKDGRPFPAMLQSTLIQDGPGTSRCILCAFTDLSDRAAAEETIREHRAEIRQLQAQQDKMLEQLDESRSQLQEQQRLQETLGAQSRQRIEQLTTTVEQKGEQLEAIQQRLARQESDFESVRAQLSEEKERLERLHAEQQGSLMAAQEALATRTAEQERLLEELTRRREQVNSTGEDAERLGREKEELEAQLAQVRENATSLAEQKETLAAANADLARRIQEVQEQIGRQSEQHAQTQARIEEEREQLRRTYDQRIEALTSQQQELEQKLTTSLETEKQLQSHIAGARRLLRSRAVRFSQIAEEVRRGRDEQKRLEGLVEQQQAKIAELASDRTADAQAVQEQMLEQIRGYEAREQQLLADIRMLTDQTRERETQIQEEMGRYAARQGELLLQIQTLRERGQEQDQQVQRRLADAEGRQTQLQATIERLKGEALKEQEQLAAKRKEHAAAERGRRSLETRLQRETQSLQKRLEKEQQRLQRTVEKNHEAMQAVRLRLDAEVQAHRETQRQLRDKQQELTRLQRRFAAQESRLAAAEEKNREYAGQLKDLRKEIRSLQQQSQRQLRSIARKLETAGERLEKERQQHKQTRQALRSEQQQVRESLGLIAVGTWSVDPHSLTVESSETLAPLLGLGAADGPVTFERMLEQVHPEDREFVRTMMTQPKHRRTKYTFQHRLQLEDGSQRVLLHHARRIHRPSEGLEQIVGSCQDVTQWRQTEEELRTHARSLEETAKQQAARIEKVEWEIRERADQYRQLESQLSRRHREMTTEVAESRTALESLQEQMRQESSAFEEQRMGYQCEIAELQQAIAGAQSELKETTSQLQRQEMNIQRLQGQLASQQERVEHEATDQKERFGLILQAMRKRLNMQKDKRESLQEQQTHLEEEMGRMSEQLRQARHRFGEQLRTHKQLEQDLLQRQQQLEAELAERQERIEKLHGELQEQNGAFRRMEADYRRRIEEIAEQLQRQASTVVGDGGDDHVMALQAVLAERTADLEQTLRRSWQDMAGPLEQVENLRGQLENALQSAGLESSQSAAVAAALEQIRASIAEMDQTVGALSQVAGTNTDDIIFESLNTQLLAEDLIAELAEVIRQAGAEVVVEDLPVCVADAIQLKFALAHLLDNAFKFKRSNEPCRVRIHGWQADGEVVLCIEDNGIGMEPASIDTAFGMFRQLNPDTPGRGVGLAVVKRIVENHRGRIAVESQPGRGATFSLILPV